MRREIKYFWIVLAIVFVVVVAVLITTRQEQLDKRGYGYLSIETGKSLLDRHYEIGLKGVVPVGFLEAESYLENSPEVAAEVRVRTDVVASALSLWWHSLSEDQLRGYASSVDSKTWSMIESLGDDTYHPNDLPHVGSLNSEVMVKKEWDELLADGLVMPGQKCPLLEDGVELSTPDPPASDPGVYDTLDFTNRNKRLRK